MLRSTIIALLLALSASASAEGFDYTYLSLGYGNIDFDGVNADGDGYVLGGSYAVSNKLHVFANYEDADLDFNVDASRWNAGIGYNTSVADTVDMFARLSYESIQFDVPATPTLDDSGFGFGVGARFDLGDRFELNAAINYVDYGDLGDDTGFEVNALYDITELFSVGIGADWSDDVSSYSLQGRFYFDK